MICYQVDIGYSCFVIEVNEETDIVKHAPGVAFWTVGKKWDDVEDYYKRKKNAKITKIKI